MTPARAAAFAVALGLLVPAGAHGADPSRVVAVDARTGAVTTIASDAEGDSVSWSPLTVRPDGTVVLDMRRDGREAFLEERTLDGRLLASRRRGRTHHGERVSRDGERVVFYEYARKRSFMVTARLDGTQRRRVASTAEGLQEMAADWTPDGGLVVARATGRTGRGTELLVLSPAGSTVRRLRCAAGNLWPNSLAVSPDGRRSAVELTVDGMARLTVIDHAAGTCRRLPVEGGSAAWSPDGRMIAVDAGPGVSLVDASAGTRRVVRTACDAEDLAWSPDGGRIAATSSTLRADGSETGWLGVVDRATATSRTLLIGVPGRVSRPMWSADGGSIVVSIDSDSI